MSKFSRFDRAAWGVMAGMAVVLAGLWGYWQFFSVSSPQSANPGGQIGARGPIAIRFGVSVDTVDAQKKIHFDPPLAGDYTWAADTAYFWPLEALASGGRYSVAVEAGIKTNDRRTTRAEASWQVQVRTPQVVYLSLSGEAELWRINAQGGEPQQLTHSDGRVYDFGISPDGEQIVYSRYDDRDGVSLWSVGRDGSDEHMLLDCGEDWCVNPAFSPDGSQLAYARKLAGVTEGSAPGVPRIWMLDWASVRTSRLYTDPNIGGSDPIWSPDGRYLAFYDGINNGLRLANLETHQDHLLPSQMGMTARWSPDGLSLFFTDIVVEESYAYETVYRYSIPTQQLARAFAEDVLPQDYGPVAFSSDGEWLVGGIRDVTGNPARQMWLMRPNGSQRSQVTQDPLVNAGALSWGPGVNQVIYQALKLGSSSAAPTVVLWDEASGEFRQLAEQAGQPAWLP